MQLAIREDSQHKALCSPPSSSFVFINDLVDIMPAGVQASLFADDLALWDLDESRFSQSTTQVCSGCTWCLVMSVDTERKCEQVRSCVL